MTTNNTCNHKWVMYQPFTGDAYECCANAGCGIRKDEYDKSTQMTFEDEMLAAHKLFKANFRTVESCSGEALRRWASREDGWHSLDKDAPWNDGDKK